MPPIEYVVLMGRGYQRREGALISSRLLQLQVMRASVRSVGYTDGKSTLIEFRRADKRPYFHDGLQRTFCGCRRQVEQRRRPYKIR